MLLYTEYYQMQTYEVIQNSIFDSFGVHCEQQLDTRNIRIHRHVIYKMLSPLSIVNDLQVLIYRQLIVNIK